MHTRFPTFLTKKAGPVKKKLILRSCFQNAVHALTGPASSPGVSRVAREARAAGLVPQGLAVGVGAAGVHAAGVEAAAEVALVGGRAVAVLVALRASRN